MLRLFANVWWIGGADRWLELLPRGVKSIVRAADQAGYRVHFETRSQNPILARFDGGSRGSV
ncbi:MAG: hypothetical protein MUF87_20170 [Anaerolineae bacterium]|jgi:hypothetical protein|nr:hypothetical protein [Anaerolineae bacterium]